MTDAIAQEGFFILKRVFGPVQIVELREDLEYALTHHLANDRSVRTRGGRVYAARNLLEVWPRAAELFKAPRLADALAQILGPGHGVVRALLFDKPPEQSWSLPWHQDLTIAVREHRPAGEQFSKPSTKAGIPHVEAPATVLEQMLAARIHLDDVSLENGPLRVLPGSHRCGKVLQFETGEIDRTILVDAGDVLLMRPLLAHCSSVSQAGTKRQRRVVHLELASAAALPDGYVWHTFLPA